MSKPGVRKGGGGAASFGGYKFQTNVASWAAVGILTEQAVTPRWDLPSDISFTEVRCEEEHPVDDILVGTSANGYAFIQAKRSLHRSTKSDSELASALDQFVRGYLVYRDKPGAHAWERPLDTGKDRLVLLCEGVAAPAWAKVHLPSVMTRFRNDKHWPTLDTAARNQNERRSAECMLCGGFDLPVGRAVAMTRYPARRSKLLPDWA